MSSVDDLVIFVEVVKAGSFTEAARRLGMTPSGVSKRISKFEYRLNARLFNRTTRKISLTHAGTLLFEKGSNIVDYVGEAESSLTELALAPRGQLRIAISDAGAKEILVPFLTEFLEKYDELQVQLIPGDGEIDLLEHRADIAFRFEKPANSSFVFKKLIDDPWVICASPDYLDKHGKPLSPAELHKHKTLFIQSYGRSTQKWEFNIDGYATDIPLSPCFSSIGLVVKEATLAGIGIARLANFLVHSDIQSGALVKLLPSYYLKNERSIYLVYPSRQYLSPKVRVFIDELEEFITKNKRTHTNT